MASDASRSGVAEPSLSADLIAQRGFSNARKGYDQDEVRGFLTQVAREYRTLRQRMAELQDAFRDAEHRATHPTWDEDSLLGAVGEETASILRSAHAAASDIRAKAEDNASRILKEAHEQAAAMRGEAEGVLKKRTDEAEAAAGRVREHAAADAERVRDAARQQSEAIRSQADADRRAVVEAAQSTRERVLADLARRRKVATVQIEQLRVGRDRLLEAYRVVQRTLDEVTDALQRADAEARAEGGAARPDGAEELGAGAGAGDHGEPEAEAEAGAAAGATGEDGAGAKAGAAAGAEAPEAVVAGGSEAPADDAGTAAAAPPARGSGPQALRSVGRAVVAPAGDEPGDEVEGVRILGVVRRQPEATPAAVEEPGPVTDAAAGATRDESDDPEPTAPTATISVLTPPEGSGATSGDPVGDAAKADDLFARIRADRATAVATARAVLAEPASEAGAEPVPAPAADPARARAARAGGSRAKRAPATAGASAIVAEVTVAEVTEVTVAEVTEVMVAEVTVVAGEPAVPDADEAALQRRDQAVATIESTLGRRLKRALQDEQNDLLDRLRGVRGQPSAAKVLPEPAAHAQRFVKASRASLDQAARAGASFVLVSLGQDAATPAGQLPDLDDLAAALAAAIVEPLRRRLEQVLDQGVDDPTALAESIGAAYREWKAQRIELTAADHVATAFARGAFAATPEGTMLRWVVEDVDGPCPDCDDNTLAGEQPKGEEFPTGQLHPPAHAGCRCLLVLPAR